MRFRPEARSLKPEVYSESQGDQPKRYRMVVYRLSDGRMGTLDYPEDVEMHPLYVAAHELVAAGTRSVVFRSSLDAVRFE